MIISDSQILDQIRDHDTRGLEALFHKYYSFLVRAAFYISSDKQVAEDLVQDVYVKIWERRSRLGNIENLQGYLTRAVQNSALDHQENNRSGQVKLAQYLYFEDQLTELPDEQTENLKDELSAALQKLPPKCRLIFSMNRMEGLTNDEIAEYLDISKRTVETQISNALKLLRVELKQVWDRYLGLFL